MMRAGEAGALTTLGPASCGSFQQCRPRWTCVRGTQHPVLDAKAWVSPVLCTPAVVPAIAVRTKAKGAEVFSGGWFR